MDFQELIIWYFTKAEGTLKNRTKEYEIDDLYRDLDALYKKENGDA